MACYSCGWFLTHTTHPNTAVDLVHRHGSNTRWQWPPAGQWAWTQQEPKSVNQATKFPRSQYNQTSVACDGTSPIHRGPNPQRIHYKRPRVTTRWEAARYRLAAVANVCDLFQSISLKLVKQLLEDKWTGIIYLAIKFGVFIEGVVELLGTLLQSQWKGGLGTCFLRPVFKVPFFKQGPQILHWMQNNMQHWVNFKYNEHIKYVFLSAVIQCSCSY